MHISLFVVNVWASLILRHTVEHTPLNGYSSMADTHDILSLPLASEFIVFQ